MKVSTIIALAKALQDADVKHIVCGGQAVVAHGYTRFTADLDLAIKLDTSSILRAVDALRSVSYRPALPVTAAQFANPEIRSSWATQKKMVVLNFVSDIDPMGTVDIFIQDQFDFESEYAQALVVEIEPGVNWHVLRLDTLIDMKRATGRAVDLDDVEHLQALKQMQLGPYS